MAHYEDFTPDSSSTVSRRTLVAAVAAGAGVMALGSRGAMAQAGPVAPPSTITSPPRDFGPNGAPTTYFTDPDVLTIDPSFDGLRQPNAPIQRLWTGSLWAEGRPGTHKAVISSGATFPTIGKCDGWKTTAT